jgi:hypothetical protein
VRAVPQLLVCKSQMACRIVDVVDDVSSQQELMEFMDSGIDFFSRMNPGAKHLYKIAKS